MMAFLSSGKLKEGLDRWREAGISNDACESVLAVSKAGGDKVVEPLLMVVDQVYESVKREGKREGDAAGGGPAKRPRMDLDAGAAPAPPEGIVFGSMPTVGKGKVDLEVRPGMGFRFVHKGTPINIPAQDIESIIKVPHPHKHKKQVLVIVNYRQVDTAPMSQLVLQLKESDKITVTDHSSGASGLPGEAEGAATATWIHAYLKTTLKVEQLLVCGSKPLPCHMGTSEGFVYLLEEGILFLTKTTFVPRDDLARIEVAGGARMTFDLQVELHTQTTNKKGESRSIMYEFMIGREHEEVVMRYISEIHASLKADSSDAGPESANDAVANEGGAADMDENATSVASESESDESEEEVSAAQALAGAVSSDEGEFDPEAESSDSCGEEYNENHQSSDED